MSALRPLLTDLAQARVAYRCVTPDELERISHSHAHQGIVAVFDAPPAVQIQAPALAQHAQTRGVWLALDGVENPHNLGAIARTAAFLGVAGLLLSQAQSGPWLSTAAFRVAEGGLDQLPVWLVQDLSQALRTLVKAGAQVVALDHRSPQSLRDLVLQDKGLRVLVAGAEEAGVSPPVLAACSHRVAIDAAQVTTRTVESLNVAAAVAIAAARMTAAV